MALLTAHKGMKNSAIPLSSRLTTPYRTRNILSRLDDKITNIDFLYVDEVQDLLVIDTKCTQTQRRNLAIDTD